MNNLFIIQLFEDPFYFITWTLFVVFSVTLHEYMHAKVALHEGDETAARLGHISLNPIKQMGISSLIMLLIIGICWGSVPVNPNNFKSKYSNLKVSLAGPLTNLALAIIFTIILAIPYLLKLDISSSFWDNFTAMFFYGALMNFVLFFFNMLPVPGFDGWALITQFINTDKIHNSEFLKGTSLCVLLIAFWGIDYICSFAAFLINCILSII